MRIGIDLRWLQEALTISNHLLGGIGYYSLNLVQNLLKMDVSNEYIFFLSQDFAVPQILRELVERYDKVRLVELPKRWRFTGRFSVNIALQRLQERLVLISQLERYNLDIYHSVHQGEPPYRIRNTASIVTVHDLTYFIYPKLLASGELYKRVFFSRLWEVRKARIIIADSQSTKEDVLRFLKVPGSKVKVIYLGVEPVFRPLAKEACIRVLRSKFGLDEDYILHVGGLSPTKNVERLLKAYKRVLSNYQTDIRLVIVGRLDFAGKYYHHYRELVSEFNLSEKIIEVGDVTTEELVVLYNCARVFVYPSLYEGFGLPIVEAMACGVPVVASSTSSLPEVVGKAGILVDPCDTSEIGSAILNVLLLDNHERAEMITRGLVQAKLFSWEKTAQATLRVYEEAYKQLHL